MSVFKKHFQHPAERGLTGSSLQEIHMVWFKCYICDYLEENVSKLEIMYHLRNIMYHL